jgi:phosphoenolpyruvate carboxylase
MTKDEIVVSTIFAGATIRRRKNELMKHHRPGEDDPRIGEGILLSINGIATALRNSG